MRDGWRRVTFGDIADLDLARVPVTAGRAFPVVGVLGFGRGILRREPVTTASTSYRELNMVRANQLVYSKLKAFEGAITVTPRDLSESFASSEFPTFTCRDVVLPEYLRLVTQQPELWSNLASMSKGLGGRRERLAPDDLLTLPLSLPPLAEQRRIVDLIGALDDAIAAADSASARASAAAREARIAIFDGKFDSVPVGEVYEVTVGKQLQSSSTSGDPTPYVRVANIADGRLDLGDLKAMRITDVELERLRLQDGDVVVVEGGWGYGKSAKWVDIGQPVAYQNHVLRIRPVNDRYDTEYAFQWARFCYENGRFKSVGSRVQNLGVGRVREMLIPVPDSDAGQKMEYLEAIDSVVCAHDADLREARGLRTHLLTVLLSGEHELPESYDELLEAV